MYQKYSKSQMMPHAYASYFADGRNTEEKNPRRTPTSNRDITSMVIHVSRYHETPIMQILIRKIEACR